MEVEVKNINFLVVMSIVLMIILLACTDEKIITFNEPENNLIDNQPSAVMDLEKVERTLEDFSAVLKEVLKNKELAEIIYNEAGSNEKDEPYALWNKIADRPTQTGMTLRKEVHSVLMKRSLGKSANAESLTSAMDEIDYLQIYIHDFEDWDGNSTLPATFTPLTINDIDVEELILYD